MNWSHGYGLAGQVVVIWLGLGTATALAYHFAKMIYLKRERRRIHLQVLQMYAERRKQEALERQRSLVVVAEALASRRTGSSFLDRARRAEALDWQDGAA